MLFNCEGTVVDETLHHLGHNEYFIKVKFDDPGWGTINTLTNFLIVINNKPELKKHRIGIR